MHKIPYVWHMKPVLLIRNDLFSESLHEKVKVNLVAAVVADKDRTHEERAFAGNYRKSNSAENVDNCKK